MTRAWVCCLCLVAGCREAAPPDPVAVKAGSLHNVYRVTPWLYSGSGPEGDGGFDALAGLGVRTVISVDGAAPDLGRARACGLRYVHLPVGYEGIPRPRALQLARAARDLPRPVYVHCHHGKHRGPAAAAAIGLCLGAMGRDRAAAWLALAGTDPRYAGLVGLPRTLGIPTADEVEGVSSDFPEVAAVPDLVKAMVGIDGLFDHLTASARIGWMPPHADIDPAHEALMLHEAYREAGRVTSEPELKAALDAAAGEAQTLETRLRAKPLDATAVTAALRAVKASCARCHDRFRDRGR